MSSRADKIARWLGTLADGTTTVLVSTRDGKPQLILSLSLDQARAQGAGQLVADAADSWAESTGGEVSFVATAIGADDRVLAASQWRAGIADKETPWATGTPEGVIHELQTLLSSTTRLHVESWKELRKGYEELLRLQRDRITELESDKTTLEATIEQHPAIDANGGIEKAQSLIQAIALAVNGLQPQAKALPETTTPPA